ncbi:hypothetical protein ZOSMA_84G00230 [Zostera marina]|uniref:Uncharacterized protein n=1 Tax=Zostera marina TaxID=29655 RepID=A0A0K9NNM8_ZOSMR|nr:hypothetical protein ZOSMA_84G00230 [Zostera marina]
MRSHVARSHESVPPLAIPQYDLTTSDWLSPIASSHNSQSGNTTFGQLGTSDTTMAVSSSQTDNDSATAPLEERSNMDTPGQGRLTRSLRPPVRMADYEWGIGKSKSDRVIGSTNLAIRTSPHPVKPQALLA